MRFPVTSSLACHLIMRYVKLSDISYHVNTMKCQYLIRKIKHDFTYNGAETTAYRGYLSYCIAYRTCSQRKWTRWAVQIVFDPYACDISVIMWRED